MFNHHSPITGPFMSHLTQFATLMTPKDNGSNYRWPSKLDEYSLVCSETLWLTLKTFETVISTIYTNLPLLWSSKAQPPLVSHTSQSDKSTITYRYQTPYLRPTLAPRSSSYQTPYLRPTLAPRSSTSESTKIITIDTGSQSHVWESETMLASLFIIPSSPIYNYHWWY